MIRVRAGIAYALTEAMDDGHCGLPSEELAPLAVELLEVPNALVQTALDLELAEGTVVADTVGGTPCIFLGGLYRAERAIGERFLKIADGKLPWPDTRCRQGTALGRGEDRPVACGGPSRCCSLGPDFQGHGHHRRAGRG